MDIDYNKSEFYDMPASSGFTFIDNLIQVMLNYAAVVNPVMRGLIY